MTVAELIELLKTFPQDLPVAYRPPQDLPVAYRLYSEYCLLEAKDVAIGELQPARDDGRVHASRPNRPTIPYVVFPGS